MLLSEKEVISLSSHLSAYNSTLHLQPTNRDTIRSTIQNRLSIGDSSFLVSISAANLRALLLMGFNDLSDQLIQAIPKTKLRNFVSELRNIDFATILYSLSDTNSRKYLISFLSGIKVKRWNFIFKHDLGVSEEYNKDLSNLKKTLESLQAVKENLSRELNGLKLKSDEIIKSNRELESIYSEHEAILKSWEDRIADAEDLFNKSEVKRQAINKKMNDRADALSKREMEISEENRKILKQKVEQSLPGYIKKTQALLKAKERSFIKIAKNWSYVGIASIMIAVYCGVFFTIYSFDFINSNHNLEWKYLLINIFKGGLVVGIFFVHCSTRIQCK